MALSAGVWLALGALQKALTPRALRGARVPETGVDERSCSDQEAHTQSGQGGVRDLSRGRDHPRPIRRHGAPGVEAAPTIVMATKDFPEEYILGELYKQALEAKGFKVNAKGSLGSTELIHTALDERQDQLLSRVHGRDRRGRPPQDVAEDGRGDVHAGQAARGEERPHAARTRRPSTTPT